MVLYLVSKPKLYNSNYKAVYRCGCWNTTVKYCNNVNSWKSYHCWCKSKQNNRKRELEWKKINNVYVKKIFDDNWTTMWCLVCGCWKEFNRKIYLWIPGSCWCNIQKITHWHTVWGRATKIYSVFTSIRRRCNNKKAKSYQHYWWRGIRCLWNSFEDFYKDMWPTYKEWLSIDRINNDWNYCKENCRWATAKEQSNNQRKSTKTKVTHWSKVKIAHTLLCQKKEPNINNKKNISEKQKDTVYYKQHRQRNPYWEKRIIVPKKRCKRINREFWKKTIYTIR